MRLWFLLLLGLILRAKFSESYDYPQVTFEPSMRDGDVVDIKGVLAMKPAPFLAEVFDQNEEAVLKVYLRGIRRQMYIKETRRDPSGHGVLFSSGQIKRGKPFKLWFRSHQGHLEVRLVNSTFETIVVKTFPSQYIVMGVKLRGTYRRSYISATRWDQHLGMTGFNGCGSRRGAAVVPKELCPDKRSKLRGRIVGGSPAKAGDHPWQVSIWKNEDHICGGVLIDDCWVLSAAHCFPQASDVKSHRVRVGDYYNKDDKDKYFDPYENSQDFNVTKIVTHEGYWPTPSTRNDIALVRLKTKSENGTCATFGDFVQPACLPQSDFQFTQHQECIITGWGASESGQNKKEFPPCLQQAEVILISKERCKEDYPDVTDGAQILDTMQCTEAKSKSNADACQGDSGGPLVCSTMAGRFTVWGVTSWGDGCGTHYGVYTKVFRYLDWVDSAMIKVTKFDPVPETRGRARNVPGA